MRRSKSGPASASRARTCHFSTSIANDAQTQVLNRPEGHELSTQSALPRLRLSHLRSRSPLDLVSFTRSAPECLAQHPSQTSDSVCKAASPACSSLKLLRRRPTNTWSVAAEASPVEAQGPRLPSWNIKPHTNTVEKRPLPRRSLFSTSTNLNAAHRI